MTTRNALFQIHWFLGITAGIILALVGVTGGLLSFEDELLREMNPGVLSVQARGEPLSPEALVARVRAQRPGERIQSLALSREATDPARVGFAPAKGAASGPGGRGPRGETRYVDPYSGALLGKPRGEGFFRTTMQLHRWLALDDVGKQIVAFSTVALIYFCLSGLYLRWPRRWGSLRTWLALDWKQKGRNFLWHLHSVVGTWMLVAYLVMSLTGLWWSYGWYRDALNNWADMPSQQQQRGEGPRQAGGARGEGERKPQELDVTAAWAAFQAQVPAWSSATLQWPRDGGGIQFRYLDADPQHERANNTLELDSATLAVKKHERYDDRPLKQKIVGSMFALHRGSFFGTTGVVLFMLASLLMPLFAITGWMLYLERRKRQRETRRLAAAGASSTSRASNNDAITLAFSSQTGNAERLAWQTAAALNDAGIATHVTSLAQLKADALANMGRVLFVVSTFGESQPPDNGRAFARRMRTWQPGSLRGLRYGILALGDSEYGDDYCGFGRELDHCLHDAGAEPLFDRVEVDAMDAGAIRHWQHHLSVLSGNTDLPDWTAPQYQAWTLAERRHLNPGSPGGAAYHIALQAPADAGATWQAGDIAEVGPRHAPGDVAAFLAGTGLSAETVVDFCDQRMRLGDALARAALPNADAVHGRDAAALAATLTPLPHREYSIASLPADGNLQFVLRRMLRPDGSPGLASGWLCDHAAIGGNIDVRLRSNPNFHAPDTQRPMILIGNGTGIGGLRAHMKARIAAGARRNWLLFGERSASADRLYTDELDAWQRDGQLQHLDLVFSRDGGQHRYVQEALRTNGERLREWLDAGAVVYVCGSLQGMAPGVDAVLVELLGQDGVDALTEAGRYRRDVY